MELHLFKKIADDSARVLAMQALGVMPGCRSCGEKLTGRSEVSFLAGKRVKCPSCDWYGTWRDNTPLHRSTLSDRVFLILWHNYTAPDSQSGIAEALGISPTTVREWRERIQQIILTQDLAA